MKKLSGLLLIALIALQPGCRKNNETVSETKAHVLYGGEPAVDGIGYYIQLDGSRENVIPINLPSGYKHTDINAAVSVQLIDVGKRYHYGDGMPGVTGLRGVYIVTIRKL